jgi:NADH-quinone oxidoreductase subunit J
VSNGSVKDIGVRLLTTYSVPFELVSLVLLVAILGALVIARSGRTKE